jgi:hypothetical protein
MTSLAFDRLSYVKKLTENGDFTPEQAEQAADALKAAFDEFIENRFADLASKRDIKELEVKLAETKADLIRWVVGVGFLQITLITALLLRLIR